MTAFVLDSSVALAWALPDEGDQAADALLDRLTQEDAIVPPIWPLEVGNVLLVAVRRQRVRSEDLDRIVSQLAMLPIQVDEDSTDRALAEVLALAAQHGLTTYDAAYLELAQRRQLPLATLDRRLREACASLKVAVLPESNSSNEP